MSTHKKNPHKKDTSNFIQYSVILPIPQLEPLIQTYRFQYNFFAQHGIPSHITLLFLFPKELYIQKSKLFDQALTLLLKTFQKKKFVIDSFYQNPHMFALDFNKQSSDFIHQVQLQIASHFGLNTKEYEDPTKRPHVTLFTQRGDKRGFQAIPEIKRSLHPHLPLHISFDRIWILEIHTRENRAKLVKEIKGTASVPFEPPA